MPKLPYFLSAQKMLLSSIMDLIKKLNECEARFKEVSELVMDPALVKDAKEIITNEDDAEMREMAREDLKELEERQPALEEEIKPCQGIYSDGPRHFLRKPIFAINPNRYPPDYPNSLVNCLKCVGQLF